MKTPDEIKKGLEKCSACGSVCDGCEFSNGNAEKWRKLMGYALAYIQQLEEKYKSAMDNAKILSNAVTQLERERDAAVHDLSKARDCCHFCKHDAVYTSVCDECNAGSNFVWRGVQETEDEHDGR